MLRNVLNPRRVIVGGELAEADDLLLNPLRETLERQTMPRSAAQLRVAPAKLGEQAAALGLVALLERRLSVHPAEVRPVAWSPDRDGTSHDHGATARRLTAAIRCPSLPKNGYEGALPFTKPAARVVRVRSHGPQDAGRDGLEPDGRTP